LSEHPHWGLTRHHGFKVHARALDHLPSATTLQRFNKHAAVTITTAVGTMYCAYSFGVLALLSLPAILTQAFHLHVFPSWLISVSLITLVAWISSYFLQLVLLPVIIVGQTVQAEAGDARAAKTFEDGEIIADRLDLETPGGLAAVMSEVRDAKIAAETASEAMKLLTAALTPKTPMVRKAAHKE
jgi:hypothetical protein